jgi:hypothetical protein
MGKSFRISASEKDTVDMDLYKTHTHNSDIPTLIKSSRFHVSKGYSICDRCIFNIFKKKVLKFSITGANDSFVVLRTVTVISDINLCTCHCGFH